MQQSEDRPVYISASQVAARYQVSIQAVFKWVREGRMPKPIKLTGGASRWKVVELEAWEESRR